MTLSGDIPVRGFMIMARDESTSDRGHGYFFPANDATGDLSKPLDCAGMPQSECQGQDNNACPGTANAMTHNSRDDKDSVSFVWTPPAQMIGTSVTFVATVVQQFSEGVSVWYENVESLHIDI